VTRQSAVELLGGGPATTRAWHALLAQHFDYEGAAVDAGSAMMQCVSDANITRLTSVGLAYTLPAKLQGSKRCHLLLQGHDTAAAQSFG
jgi:hypothetical protein